MKDFLIVAFDYVLLRYKCQKKKIAFAPRYSVVSIKQTGCNKRTGWAEFFHLLHEKRVQGGVKNIFIT